MYYNRGELIGGVDEAGVCDIAGPLVAACVILPKIDLHRDDLRIFEVNDSKQIPVSKRKYYAEIVWQVALGIGIGEVQPAEYDYLGRGSAVKLAMLRAVTACKKTTTKKQLTPDFLIIDGRVPINTTIPKKGIIRADEKSLSVAAASIVAKVYRDEIMIRYHEQFPYYGWNTNKGHPSEEHFKGIDKHGIQIGIHRVKVWPFRARPEDSKTTWETRRGAWRKTTENNLSSCLGDLWMPKNTKTES